MMDKPEIVRAWCAARVGCPYVYGATGKPCTPSYREARMRQYPAYAEKIKRNCLYLSGKAGYCDECRWCDPETGVGKPAYDCAQLSRWAMDAVGIKLVSGANSQWERTAWAERGEIGTLPTDRVCLVFRWDADKGKMGHVGVYQGDSTVTHAKGHDYGVVNQPIEDVKFTHWGIPYGLYTEKPIVNHPTLRKGDSGEDVRQMQKSLILLNYLPVGADDGRFGGQTESALRRFQQDNYLTADGVCGPKTWDALERETGHDAIKPDDAVETPDDAVETPDDEIDRQDDVTISREDWDALCRIIDKYRSVG